MPIFDKDRGHLAVLAVLLTANGLLYLALPWVRDLPVQGDPSDRLIATGDGRIRPEVLTRNPGYLEWCFEAVRGEKDVLCLGSSETTTHYNLAAQLNQLEPKSPRMVVIAGPGLSPISMCVILSRSKREGLAFPPMVLLVNPIYFTNSHDVINDGWLERYVVPPGFLQMNHRGWTDCLSEDVRAAYAEHFALQQVLYPVTVQAYVGNLVYLRFHPLRPAPASDAAELPVPLYAFDGRLPEYDEARGVAAGYRAADRLGKHRWRVKPADQCVNVKAVVSAAAILGDQPAPVLVVLLPMNRRFYQYNGLDMVEFDRQLGKIRKIIGDCAAARSLFMIDLSESPKLHLGFRDRMHLDEYGNSQLARHMVRSDQYDRFMAAVRAYYAGSRRRSSPWAAEAVERIADRRAKGSPCVPADE